MLEDSMFCSCYELEIFESTLRFRKVLSFICCKCYCTFCTVFVSCKQFYFYSMAIGDACIEPDLRNLKGHVTAEAKKLVMSWPPLYRQCLFPQTKLTKLNRLHEPLAATISRPRSTKHFQQLHTTVICAKVSRLRLGCFSA